MPQLPLPPGGMVSKHASHSTRSKKAAMQVCRKTISQSGQGATVHPVQVALHTSPAGQSLCSPGGSHVSPDSMFPSPHVGGGNVVLVVVVVGSVVVVGANVVLVVG